MALVSMLGGLSRTACADETAEAEGAALMDRYVEVTGGQASYAAMTSRVVKGRCVMADGAVRRFESYWVAPDRFRSVVELPVGVLERGSDGKTVWISFPADAAIVTGAHRVAVLRNSPEERFGRWRDVYRKAEYVGHQTVEGTECSKVVLTYKPLDPQVAESPVTVFIAEDSGLIVRWTTRVERQGPGADRDALDIIDLGDYRKVGDIRVPHRLKIRARGEEISLTVEEVLVNVAVTADQLAPPEAIQEQLKARESQR